MEQGSGRFLRENAFLAAAVCLPLLVVVFFVLASIIPRWLVAPPAYDYRRRLFRFTVRSTERGAGIYLPEHSWDASGGVEWSAPGAPPRGD